MRTFKYVGSIDHITLGTSPHIATLYNYEDRGIPPVKVQVNDGMFDYIRDLSDHDDEEKYLEKEIYYDSNLNLLAIVIPSRGRWPAKVIISGQADYENELIESEAVEIYGPSSRLEERRPKSMSEVEYERLYNDLHKMMNWNITEYEYPVDHYETIRRQSAEIKRLEGRIHDLQERLTRIAHVANMENKL